MNNGEKKNRSYRAYEFFTFTGILCKINSLKSASHTENVPMVYQMISEVCKCFMFKVYKMEEVVLRV